MSRRLPTGKRQGSPLVHRGALLAVSISDDGNLVVTEGEDNTYRFWDVAFWDVATGWPLASPWQHPLATSRFTRLCGNHCCKSSSQWRLRRTELAVAAGCRRHRPAATPAFVARSPHWPNLAAAWEDASSSAARMAGAHVPAATAGWTGRCTGTPSALSLNSLGWLPEVRRLGHSKPAPNQQPAIGLTAPGNHTAATGGWRNYLRLEGLSLRIAAGSSGSTKPSTPRPSSNRIWTSSLTSSTRASQ